MNRMFIMIAASIMLAACSADRTPSTEVSTTNTDLPSGLKDCKVYKVNVTGAPWLWVTRCPGSSTVTQYETGGKASTTVPTVVIDGQEYVKK